MAWHSFARSKKCLQDADAAQLAERPELKQYRRRNLSGRGGFLLAPRVEVVSPLKGLSEIFARVIAPRNQNSVRRVQIKLGSPSTVQHEGVVPKTL